MKVAHNIDYALRHRLVLRRPIPLLHNGAYLPASVSRNFAKVREHSRSWLDLAGSPALNCPTIDRERLGHVLDPVAGRPESASDLAHTCGVGCGYRKFNPS